jgi:hypothetical protein
MERLAAPLNSTVRLVIRIPVEGKLQGYLLEGKVVWKRINATGVRFVDPPEQPLQAIRDFVAAA